MSRRKITFIVVALIVLLGGSAALSYLFISMKPEPPTRPGIDMKRFVKAEVVQYSTIVSPVLSEGRVVSSSEVMLIAEASGRIEKGAVDLRKGTSFKKGQLLAVIYKDEVELALKARKSRFLSSIIGILTDVKLDFPEYYADYEAFFNQIDMDQKLPSLPKINNEKLKVYLASQNFLSEYYGIQQDEKKLSRHSLYAPFDGSFTQVNSEVGAYANAGGQIGRMIRTDQLEVEVPVINEQSKWIRIGDSVKVYENRKSFQKGIVIRKADFIDQDTQSRSIFVKVPYTAKNKLLAGEYKLVEFEGQEISNAMEVPRNVVFNSDEVFLIEQGKLKKAVVNVLKWNETSLIFNGLKEGDVLVAEPLINAKENNSVGIIGQEETDPQGNHSSEKQSKSN